MLLTDLIHLICCFFIISLLIATLCGGELAGVMRRFRKWKLEQRLPGSAGSSRHH